MAFAIWENKMFLPICVLMTYLVTSANQSLAADQFFIDLKVNIDMKYEAKYILAF